MREDVRRDFEFAHGFLGPMKRILGFHLIEVADEYRDMRENSDLVVLKLDSVRVACRVRKYRYWKQYGHEFTIRTSRPSGVKTELEKLLEGFGDFILYGFANANASENVLHAWGIGDLEVFRNWWWSFAPQQPPCRSKPNRDGSSEFKIFEWNAVSKGFLIGGSSTLCQRLAVPVPQTKIVECVARTIVKNRTLFDGQGEAA